jgi:hypothetical protein
LQALAGILIVDDLVIGDGNVLAARNIDHVEAVWRRLLKQAPRGSSRLQGVIVRTIPSR